MGTEIEPDSLIDDFYMTHRALHQGTNFSPHRYESGNGVIQYDFGAQQSLTNIAWSALETGDWEGDISKIEVYDQDLSAWTQVGGASPTSPIDLSGSPVTIGSAALADIIRVTVDPKADTLQSETAKLLDMTLIYQAAGLPNIRAYNALYNAGYNRRYG